jgi:glycerate dehydrogenase
LIRRALTKGVFLDLETVDRGDLDRSRLAASLPHWDWHAWTGAEEIAARIRRADVVVTNKCLLDLAALRGADSLRLVAVAATGTNNVDLETARAAGITVCNIRDYCTEAVAQHTVTLMLNLLTGQPWYRDRVRHGDWSESRQFCLQDRPIREARGLVFGVIGYGSLGRAVAAKAASLGLEVLVAERRGQPLRAGRSAFEEVLRRADVLSIHCPLSTATRNLIDREELRAMKPDAILINTARGGIIDEQALADGLREGQIGGAGIDTLSEEPPPRDHPLLADDIPNLLLTPHNAWASRSARQAALDQLATVIEAFTAGEPIHVVSGAAELTDRGRSGA